MTKLNVWAIPETGNPLKFTEKDEWVRSAFLDTYQDDSPDINALKGLMKLSRFNDLISIDADFTLPLKAKCIRCLEDAPTIVSSSFHMDLSPAYLSEDKGSKKHAAQELELNSDDVDFTFYEGNEVNLEEILKEQLVLNQETMFLCRTDCLGLCPKCAINLNNSKCDCSSVELEESPWAALKQLKVKH